jgi:DNA-binding NarL/FixJ family response regulator
MTSAVVKKKVAKTTVLISDVAWDPSIYPRQKWNTSTIERYKDAIEAGEEFPPIVLEAGTNRLLDGKHRLEAYKAAGVETVPAEMHEVPHGMTAKYYAAILSARHGDRMSNTDLKTLAEEEFEADYLANGDSTLDAQEWGRSLGISKSTVYRWVSHIMERGKASRAAKAWRLSQLGWTQAEIGERLGVDDTTVSKDLKNSQLGKIQVDLGEHWNDKGVAEVANRLGLPLCDAMAAAMVGMDDEDRLKQLGIKVQPYDVWNFPSCHDLMGDKHPGRIPGELVAHVLYFLTKPGELVVDPMAGSGTTLDACLLMGRKARGYDIDHRHKRCDVEFNNLSFSWPSKVEGASLVFWDPPYYDKMDHGTIGDDGYIEGSISGLDPHEYLTWFGKRFAELHQSMEKGARLAFLMSDWDSENAKKHEGHAGLWLWDYADILRDAGFTMERHIQVPLGTQQVHPDIVNKFRASRRMARLERYLLVARK